MQELTREQCTFSHRHSVFHNQRYVILGAVIRCVPMSRDEARRIKETRLQFCKEKFEYGKGCFGTCFSTVSYKVLRVASMLCKLRKVGGKRVVFSKNNVNWLVNRGDGRYKDVVRMIDVCKWMHHVLRKPVKCEVVIWE